MYCRKCENLIDCNFCIDCKDLVGQSLMIKNKQVTSEEFWDEFHSGKYSYE
jgi:hypothetical protein